jgi:hypothetical protein
LTLIEALIIVFQPDRKTEGSEVTAAAENVMSSSAKIGSSQRRF